MQTDSSYTHSSSAHCWRLTVRDSFAAAHALRNYKGKCEHLHGHNFSVSVEIEGRVLSPDTELLLDFSTLKQGLKEVLESLDHKLLNELPFFAHCNPSSENLAHHIYQAMKLWLVACADAQDRHVRIVSVTVGESDKQCATYMEWQDDGRAR